MATLKISDLSVGDWVHHDFYGVDMRVVNIYGNRESVIAASRSNRGITCHLDHFTPIPITAEMLEKNGWFRLDFQCVLNIEDNRGTSHDGEYVIMWYVDDEYLTISWGGRENDALVEREMMECRVKYIHQLQHALRFAGVDKEINL